MRDIIYRCDACGREYQRQISAKDLDRGLLCKIDKYEVCRACLKQVLEYIETLKIAKVA